MVGKLLNESLPTTTLAAPRVACKTVHTATWCSHRQALPKRPSEWISWLKSTAHSLLLLTLLASHPFAALAPDCLADSQTRSTPQRGVEGAQPSFVSMHHLPTSSAPQRGVGSPSHPVGPSAPCLKRCLPAYRPPCRPCVSSPPPHRLAGC